MNKFTLSDIAQQADTCPILIAGPTASGKSALAMEIAERFGGAILNADAFQIYSNWQVLTARPSKVDEDKAPHFLYGHIAPNAAYSVGHWLAEITPLLNAPRRSIITGGTGLYFQALTKGLANIPAIPPDIREAAEEEKSKNGFGSLLSELDSATKTKLTAKTQCAFKGLGKCRKPPDDRLPSGKPLPPSRSCQKRDVSRFYAMLIEIG